MNRKLDAAIAGLLGVGKVKNPYEPDDEFPRYGYEEYIYPYYSSDMNEAVKLLKDLNRWELYLNVDQDENGAAIWNLYHDNKLEPCDVYHENPAMAICLAAYKLKTGEDWNDL